MNLLEQAYLHTTNENPGLSAAEEFVRSVSGIQNGGIQQVEDYLRRMHPSIRYQFIERCSSLIGAAASIDANS